MFRAPAGGGAPSVPDGAGFSYGVWAWRGPGRSPGCFGKNNPT